MTKYILFPVVLFTVFIASCSQCVECNGTSYCKQSGAQYTDSLGNNISWDEYAASIEAQCD